jgi:hypothetical protein
MGLLSYDYMTEEVHRQAGVVEEKSIATAAASPHDARP